MPGIEASPGTGFGPEGGQCQFPVKTKINISIDSADTLFVLMTCLAELLCKTGLHEKDECLILAAAGK